MIAAANPRQTLRRQLSARRHALTPAARISAAHGVHASLQQLAEFMTDERIAGYWAINGELPLNLAVAALAARGQRYLLPVIAGERQLRFATWSTGAPLQPNRFGIPEPVVAVDALLLAQRLDLVLVPLLAFDRRGQRLGYGGGFYDRSFAFLAARARPGRPLLVGVGYAFQELPHIESEPWDIRLDYVATDAGLIDCGQSGGAAPEE